MVDAWGRDDLCAYQYPHEAWQLLLAASCHFGLRTELLTLAGFNFWDRN